MKRSRLTRKTPMPRGSLRSKPSASGGKKPCKPGTHAGVNKARGLVKERSGGDCEIRMLGCHGTATDWHHRLRQSQGGKWHVQNGLHLCRFCHEAVTNTRGHREEHERKGWLVPSHEDPALKKCWIYTQEYGREWVFLLEEPPFVELAPWPERDERHPDDLEVPRVDPELDGAA